MTSQKAEKVLKTLKSTLEINKGKDGKEWRSGEKSYTGNGQKKAVLPRPMDSQSTGSPSETLKWKTYKTSSESKREERVRRIIVGEMP